MPDKKITLALSKDDLEWLEVGLENYEGWRCADPEWDPQAEGFESIQKRVKRALAKF